MAKALVGQSRRLAVRLIFLISLAIIPVNILAVVLTRISITDFQSRLRESYRNELTTYMLRIDAELQDIEEEAMAFIAANIFELALGASPDDPIILRIRLYDDLRRVRERLDLATVACLKHNPSGEVAVAFGQSLAGANYDAATIQTIKALCADSNLLQRSANRYVVVTAGRRTFLLKNYPNRAYTFAFLIDARDLLSGASNLRASEGEQFFLTDDAGHPLVAMTTDGEVVSVATDASRPLSVMLGERRAADVIAASSERMDYRLVRVLDANSLATRIPLTNRILQVVAILSFLIIPLTWLTIRQLALKPIRVLADAMHEVEAGNLQHQVTVQANTDEFQYLYESFNRMVAQIDLLTIQSYENEIERLQIEWENLRLQINPHLILNSLNMIYSLAQSKNYPVILEYVRRLADYFRYALRQNGDLVPLAAEMSFVQNYLEVQKIRFPDAFTVSYAIDEGLEDALTPPLLIQNFVENSIKHGLKLGDVTEVAIEVRRQGDAMAITVADTGSGVAPEILEKLTNGEIIENKTGRHIGVWNCRRRLRYFYGDRASLTIASILGKGTQVRIVLPIVRNRSEGAGASATTSPLGMEGKA